MTETERLVEDTFLDAALEQCRIFCPCPISITGFGKWRVQRFENWAVRLRVTPPFLMERVSEVARQSVNNRLHRGFAQTVSFEPLLEERLNICD